MRWHNSSVESLAHHLSHEPQMHAPGEREDTFEVKEVPMGLYDTLAGTKGLYSGDTANSEQLRSELEAAADISVLVLLLIFTS